VTATPSMDAAPEIGPVYDSALDKPSVIADLRTLWARRDLVWLLARHNLTLRYKRSLLGVLWTLLVPLLTMMILAAIFSRIFRIPAADVPYAVYVFSGMVLFAFFQSALLAGGGSLVSSGGVLTKLHLPTAAFPVAAAIAAAISFGIALVPLAALQLGLGAGLPWTFPLVALPTICLLALCAGLALLLSPLVVRFFDLMDVVSVAVGILVWATPTFYPLSIVPEDYRFLIYANPVYHYLRVFRDFAYGGVFAPWWAFAVMIGTASLALAAGIVVFARLRRGVAAMV
jgi:ABC-type polysaccharide/polyol phosphate export permease